MMKNHQALALILSLLAAVLLSACGNTEQAAEQQVETQSVVEQTPPAPTANPSPTPDSAPNRYTFFKETADALRITVDGMDGIVSADIQANTLNTDMTVTIVIDDAQWPIESFQTFVLSITDKLNESLRMVEDEMRIRIEISYPYRSDTRASWNHFANDEDIYHGSLSYGSGTPISAYMDAHDITTNLESDTFTNPTPVNLPSCSYEEYLQIENGMTYDQVVEIIGSEGKEISTATTGGITSSVYQWDGSAKYSNVAITFTNNAVVAKAQAGLG